MIEPEQAVVVYGVCFMGTEIQARETSIVMMNASDSLVQLLNAALVSKVQGRMLLEL